MVAADGLFVIAASAGPHHLLSPSGCLIKTNDADDIAIPMEMTSSVPSYLLIHFTKRTFKLCNLTRTHTHNRKAHYGVFILFLSLWHSTYYIHIHIYIVQDGKKRLFGLLHFISSPRLFRYKTKNILSFLCVLEGNKSASLIKILGSKTKRYILFLLFWGAELHNDSSWSLSSLFSFPIYLKACIHRERYNIVNEQF